MPQTQTEEESDSECDEYDDESETSFEDDSGSEAGFADDEAESSPIKGRR